MIGVIQFMKGLVYIAIALGAAGTLVEATGLIGQEAVKAHRKGGISFKSLNQHLVGTSSLRGSQKPVSKRKLTQNP